MTYLVIIAIFELRRSKGRILYFGSIEMTLSDKGVIIKVVLIVLLIILFVVEFFTLFAAIIQMIIHDNNPNLLYDGILMAIVAIIVISLSFYGILGSVRENYLNLFVFAGILGTVLLISLMIQLLLIPPNNEEVQEEDISEKRNNVDMIDDSSFDIAPLELSSYWKDKKRSIHRMHEANHGNEASNLKTHTFSMDMWDIIHQKFRCCGPSGPISWTESNLTIPYSCCHVKDNSADPITENCSRSNEGPYMYTEGCALFVHAFLSSKKDSSSEVTLAVLMRVIGYLLQFATVLLAAWLGILILMSRRQEYDFHPKKQHQIVDNY
ncbi:hypothetical protein WA026_008619 [Henosepilachna vigintioctopunctata]|uniref:Tetraspanin n=1 Tax=Henosepilachna vigintioctopunctata TaxID=420089 RepID=A0AAW1UHA3_9CUCU